MGKMKFKALLLILFLAVGISGLRFVGAAWADPVADDSRPDSVTDDLAEQSADLRDKSDSSRVEFFELLNMGMPLSDGDLDLAFEEARNKLDIEFSLARAFIDSISERILSGPVSGETIDSAYLENLGAQAWESMNTAEPYRPGFTVALKNAMQELADLQEEDDIEYDEEEEEEEEEEEAIAPILFALIIIILAAKLGGDLVERFRQPAVLGELIFGMILGNLALIGIHLFEPLRHHITIEILAEIGVIILLFEVGLESSIKEMMSVGLTSFFVALIGIVAPFFLGWWISALFFPQESIFIHIFIGATLTATSVGITARVLKDIGKIRTREAKIILGAAVFDDIMGLVVLAVVVGIVGAHNTGGTLSSLSVFWIVAKAFIFILGSLSLGTIVAPPFFRMASKLRAQSVLITFSLMFCFVFAFLADRIGLAPIVGAFAAGMILSGINFNDIFTHEERKLQELLGPISAFLVPIFFIYMGMNVDLSTLGNVNVIFFALVLTIAAILGKQICSLAGVFERKINSWAIGVGMIPRGEVGLIFAGIGAKLQIDGVKVVSPDAYSAVIIMVMVTTLVTPPVLKTIFADRSL
jgi:Kef-type K+ transport system membrane component KefB